MAASAQPEAGRPRIGLVLGGGGARGAAHVGVLKVLKEMHVPVDVVVGTSMGALVGGLYASGMSPEEIEQEIDTIDWKDIFRDTPKRADRSFRRKQDDQNYAVKHKLGLSGGKPTIPPAYIRGQKFDLVLNRLTLPVATARNFDQLTIPFRAVATDLETGKKVVLGSGDLARAIRASIAVPAAFDPVDIDGRLLVDGGISDNLPVDVARAMGADVVIVVDVGGELASRERLRSAFNITGQLTGLLFKLNTEEQLRSLGPNDILLRPRLGNLSATDFSRAKDAIPAGEEAARQNLQALSRYSLSPEAYRQFVADHEKRREPPPVIQFVRVVNESSIGTDVIRSRISARPGQPLDVARLEQDIDRIYGLDIFQSVRYQIVQEDGRTGLVVTAKEKSWGPGYLQFGVAASNNFQGDSITRVGVLYTRTEMNALNGEWRMQLQAGDEPLIAADVYQPLDPFSRYFVTGKAEYSRLLFNIYDAHGHNLERYRVDNYGVELAGGRDFGTWGEARIGYRRLPGTAHIIVGNPAPDIDINRGEVFLRLSDDKLDNPYFPSSGYYGRSEYRKASEALGSSQDYQQVDLRHLYAHSWGRHTLMAGAIAASTFDGTAPIGSLYRLGGFLRLSGLQEDQISGQYAGLLSLTYLRRQYKLAFINAYLGASVQVGNVWQRTADVSLSNSLWSGTLFVGADTPIGPLYVGFGATDRQDRSLYLILGPRFIF